VESAVVIRLAVPVFALGVLLGCSNSAAPGGGGGFATPDILFPDVQVKLDSGGSELGVDSQQADDTAGSDVAAGLSDVAAATDATGLTDAVTGPDTAVADSAVVDAEPDLPDFGNFFDDTEESPDTSPFAGCSAGTLLCKGKTAQTCDGAGGLSATEVCPGACLAGVGCVLCIPGSTQCDQTSAQLCNDTGTAWLPSSCDAELGLSCDLKSGTCAGPCATSNLERSYIGCEYWPTVTANAGLYNGFQFAVAIASASEAVADVVIYKGAVQVATAKVQPGAVATVQLPWVQALKRDTSGAANKAQFDAAFASVLLSNGAYHLKSTQPVTVSQFNPLQFQIPFDGTCPNQLGTGTCNSYTNDASMLLPVNALGTDYYALSWPAGAYWNPTYKLLSSPGFVSVVATENDTKVHIDSAASVRAGTGVVAMAAGTGQDFVLQAGDVLQLLTSSPPNPGNTLACASQPNGAKLCPTPAGYDLSGSSITASAPVQVLAGHDCANVPGAVAACDHIEESLFPLSTWGTSVLVAPPQSVTGAAKANGQADVQIVRIVSGAAGNQLSFEPPIAAIGNPVLAAGQVLELALDKNARQINATGPILVAQYMAGGDQVDPGNAGTSASKGDPSMSLAVPTKQFRSEYVFLVPATYTYSFVNIIANKDTALTLDGNPVVANFAPIGTSGYGVARVKLAGGNHNISGDSPFGIVVYGYAAYTSYMYPGGLNLAIKAK
jgi:hypothetical protein